jgi:hemerythrin
MSDTPKFAALQWTPKLSVGYADIDEQHKELFVRVNRLLSAMGEGRGKDDVQGVMQFLKQYTVTHFGMEQERMARFGYPDRAAHIAQHTAFIADLDWLSQTLAAQGATVGLAIQVQRRVVDWLLHHVGKTDMALGPFLAAQAVGNSALRAVA